VHACVMFDVLQFLIVVEVDKVIIKLPPQSGSLCNGTVHLFVRLSVSCNAYCCRRRGLIVLAIWVVLTDLFNVKL